jgi:hypothetical protein
MESWRSPNTMCRASTSSEKRCPLQAEQLPGSKAVAHGHRAAATPDRRLPGGERKMEAEIRFRGEVIMRLPV